MIILETGRFAGRFATSRRSPGRKGAAVAFAQKKMAAARPTSEINCGDSCFCGLVHPSDFHGIFVGGENPLK